jgi:Restriction alleviation protein Lar
MNKQVCVAWPATIEPKPGELLECPFCGSPAMFEHDTTGTMAGWSVYCCDTEEVCPIGLTDTIDYPRRVEAAAAWNRRRTAL